MIADGTRPPRLSARDGGQKLQIDVYAFFTGRF